RPPTPPLTGGPLENRLSGKSGRSKRDLRGVPRRNAAFPVTWPLLLLGRLGGLGFLEGSAEDVAKRRARIRRAILRDSLLLLGDLQCLHGEVRLLRSIESDHHCIQLLADLESLRTLLVPVAAKIASLDEAGGALVANLNVKS